jgi:phospholipase C
VLIGCNAFPIEHWIVVMMENRSFDHMIGFLKSLNPDIEGLDGTESNPYNPFDPNSPRVKVNPFSPDVDPNAGHSLDATTQEVFGGANQTNVAVPPMNGFVAAAESMEAGWGPQVMSCFNHTSLPILSTLAMEFTLFDHWHASLPGPTEPNRAFLHSCSSDGLTDNDPEVLTEGFPQKTLQESLMEVNRDWMVWYDEFPTTLFMRPLRYYPFHFETMESFYSAVESGDLPDYSFVEPRYFSIVGEFLGNDQHPNHEVSQGELFLKNVYEAVRASPVWNKTALIITYDEHGGYYDHVPTPLNIPNPDGVVSTDPPFNFTRSGIRVPAIIASPWVKKGRVVHRPTNGPTPTSEYEHCSIASTFKKVYNIPHFLNARDTWASPFDDVFDLDAPRTDCPTTLPPVFPSLAKPNQPDQPMHDLQLTMVRIANYLNGNADDITKLTTEKEGGTYVKQRIAQFFEKQREVLRNKNDL